MYIYRIEHHKSGNGPYNHLTNGSREVYYGNDILKSHGTATYKTHPRMFDDCKMMEDSQYFAGFNSIEQLFAWFDGTLSYLHKHDFELRIYETDDQNVVIGTYQLIFIKHLSKVTDRLSLMDVLALR